MTKMKELTSLNKVLHVGVIQTSLHADTAWVDDTSGDWKRCIRMSSTEELRAKKEIRHYLASLKGLDLQPDFVLLPELSVPLGFEHRLKRATEKMESIVIAGLDYRVDDTRPRSVSNETIVIVPKRLKGKKISRRTEIRRVGKTYPAPKEKRKLDGITGGRVDFVPQPVVWLFESQDLGRFAIAVCYDFLDLDRIAMYRNKIQTLFILAYNKDTTSFDHAAEAIARMVFCNVVVCNCGYFGGSLAVSPFQDPHKRTVYKHAGQRLPNAQLIELPLASLHEHQSTGSSAEFKSLPPGFTHSFMLMKNLHRID